MAFAFVGLFVVVGVEISVVTLGQLVLVVDADDAVVALLEKHGIATEVLLRAISVEAEVFVPDAVKRSSSRFAGPSVVVSGSYQRRPLEVAKGAVLVRGRQRLARLAAQLLEPQSEDSLTTWGLFGARVVDPETAVAEGGLRFPVVRLTEIPADLR